MEWVWSDFVHNIVSEEELANLPRSHTNTLTKL